MNSIKFDREEAREIIYGNHSDYTVITDEITDTSRWSAHHTVVVEDNEAGTFWQTHYSEGLTECQDEQAFDDEPIVQFTRVEPVEVTKVEYRAVA